MARIVMEGKLLKWGNSYGVRVAKQDVERARLSVGAPMTVTPGKPELLDLSALPTFSDAGFDAVAQHDDEIAAAVIDDANRTWKLPRRRGSKARTPPRVRRSS